MTDTASWVARIDFTGPVSGDAEALGADLLDALAADAVSCGPGHISVRLGLDVTGGYSSAAAAVHTLIGSNVPTDWEIAGVEVQREDLLDAELAQPFMPELVGISEAGQMLGVTRQRAHAIAQTADFPSPLASLASGPVFLRSAVAAFAARPRRNGRPSKKVLEHAEMLRRRAEETEAGTAVPLDRSMLSDN